jgi:hypothetical protein
MAKVFGKVEKIRPGPELGSNPKEKTAGKMANPAKIPATEAPTPVNTAFFGILASLFR